VKGTSLGLIQEFEKAKFDKLCTIDDRDCRKLVGLNVCNRLLQFILEMRIKPYTNPSFSLLRLYPDVYADMWAIKNCPGQRVYVDYMKRKSIEVLSYLGDYSLKKLYRHYLVLLKDEKLGRRVLDKNHLADLFSHVCWLQWVTRLKTSSLLLRRYAGSREMNLVGVIPHIREREKEEIDYAHRISGAIMKGNYPKFLVTIIGAWFHCHERRFWQNPKGYAKEADEEFVRTLDALERWLHAKI
jgi:hypothetical protein